MARITSVPAQKSQVLAIIGQGYVGLPLAMAAVDAGWTVIGIDNFEAKVSQINFQHSLTSCSYNNLCADST